MTGVSDIPAHVTIPFEDAIPRLCVTGRDVGRGHEMLKLLVSRQRLQ